MRKLITLFVAIHLITVSLKAQDSTKLDFQRIGFASLFKIKTTGNQEKPFQYELNPKAISFIQTYLDKEGPALKKMKTWARPYFNLYDQILIANGIPVQLKYLSVIESSLDANVVSWAGAAGPWQLMPDEAQRLGLKLTPIDERTDYQKSTVAAAVILRELYTEFNDWLLVVAAYNGGLGRVRKAIKKKGNDNFWNIQYELPLETRNHVKKFIATQYVFETEDNMLQFNPNADTTADKPLEIPKEYSAISISGRFTYKAIASAIQFDEQLLRKYNPGLEKIVATGKSYELKLPATSLEKFKAHKNEILQASIQSLYKLD
jgi:membrane-bound lytic murein transglycosylase D